MNTISFEMMVGTFQLLIVFFLIAISLQLVSYLFLEVILKIQWFLYDNSNRVERLSKRIKNLVKLQPKQHSVKKTYNILL